MQLRNLITVLVIFCSWGVIFAEAPKQSHTIQITSHDFTQGVLQAIYQDNVALVDNLMQAWRVTGAPQNVSADQMAKFLKEAACYGNPLIVQLLLKNLPNLKVAKSYVATSALMEAVNNGHLEIVKILLQAGVNVNAVDQRGFTALMFACKRGYAEIVRELLKRGAKVDLTNQDGDSALMLAIFHGYTKIVRLLLDAKANIHLVNNERLDAIGLAQRNHRYAILQLLTAKR